MTTKRRVARWLGLAVVASMSLLGLPAVQVAVPPAAQAITGDFPGGWRGTVKSTLVLPQSFTGQYKQQTRITTLFQLDGTQDYALVKGHNAWEQGATVTATYNYFRTPVASPSSWCSESEVSSSTQLEPTQAFQLTHTVSSGYRFSGLADITWPSTRTSSCAAPLTGNLTPVNPHFDMGHAAYAAGTLTLAGTRKEVFPGGYWIYTWNLTRKPQMKLTAQFAYSGQVVGSSAYLSGSDTADVWLDTDMAHRLAGMYVCLAGSWRGTALNEIATTLPLLWNGQTGPFLDPPGESWTLVSRSVGADTKGATYEELVRIDKCGPQGAGSDLQHQGRQLTIASPRGAFTSVDHALAVKVYNVNQQMIASTNTVFKSTTPRLAVTLANKKTVTLNFTS